MLFVDVADGVEQLILGAQRRIVRKLRLEAAGVLRRGVDDAAIELEHRSRQRPHMRRNLFWLWIEPHAEQRLLPPRRGVEAADETGLSHGCRSRGSAGCAATHKAPPRTPP